MNKKKKEMILRCFLLALGIFSVSSRFLDAKNPKPQLAEVTEENSDSLDNPHYSVDQDTWFGPGYYYGIWFEEEPAYWQWRGQHEEFPPNHDYYSPDKRIYYKKGRYSEYWKE